MEAEERGIAYSISQNLLEMARLKTPILTCVIGEGGSGGALGIAVGDRVIMQENAYYSVISPEGCSSILWRGKEKGKNKLAAEGLKLEAKDLLKFGIIDEIVIEPNKGTHKDSEMAAKELHICVKRNLEELLKLEMEELLEKRGKNGEKLENIFKKGIKFEYEKG